jgi:Major Facilitator Superfamily
MSFCTSSTWWLLAILFTVVGFGSGTTFIAALSTSIRMLPNNTGVAVAFTGGAMSLSMAWVGAVIAAYANSQECSIELGNTDCWRGQLRLVALICALLVIPTIYVFWMADRARATPEETNSITVIEDLSSGKSDEFGQIQMDFEDGEAAENRDTPALPSPQETPVGLLESLRIIPNVFFLILAFSFMVGIGAGLLVVTKTSSLWSSFTLGEHQSWTTVITICFSVANACIGGGISGILSDALQKVGSFASWVCGVWSLHGWLVDWLVDCFLLVCVCLLEPLQFRTFFFINLPSTNSSSPTSVFLTFSPPPPPPPSPPLPLPPLPPVFLCVSLQRGISRQYTTAVIFMAFSTVYFAIGGMQFIPEETRINNSGVQVIYMLLIIVTGMFFGTNFVTFPSMVGEFYGHLNFGVYFGYMQILTAVSTFAVPALATFVYNSNVGVVLCVRVYVCVWVYMSCLSVFVHVCVR